MPRIKRRTNVHQGPPHTEEELEAKLERLQETSKLDKPQFEQDLMRMSIAKTERKLAKLKKAEKKRAKAKEK